jgi:hypothetical protein
VLGAGAVDLEAVGGTGGDERSVVEAQLALPRRATDGLAGGRRPDRPRRGGDAAALADRGQ